MHIHHVVAAALIEGDRILLCHRSPTRRWYPNVWDLPGGHIEASETEIDAVRRELQEELGIEAHAVDDEPWAHIENGSPGAPEGVLKLSIWLVRRWRGNPTNRAPEEHDQIRWATSSELDSLPLAHERYAEILRDMLARLS